MSRLILDASEVSAIRTLLSELISQYSSAEDEGFLKDVPVFAHELPRRVRRFLNDFKQLEPAPGVCVISGYPVDGARIGPTPAHWRSMGGVSPALAEEMLFLLCASLLGEVFGWATQQGGRLIHEVLPIKEDEDEQMGTGSKQTIWWHNEEAFHPYRSDYVGLMCLRNHDSVPTTFASVDMLELDAEVIGQLFEPRYTIMPDDTHTSVSNWRDGGPATRSRLPVGASKRCSTTRGRNPSCSATRGRPTCASTLTTCRRPTTAIRCAPSTRSPAR